MKSKGTITTSEYIKASAEILYENEQLIISTKPEWVRICFGVVGEALAPAKERFRINISDVLSLSISETWMGKPVYELKLSDNDTCKIVFNSEDDLAIKLKNDLIEIVEAK